MLLSAKSMTAMLSFTGTIKAKALNKLLPAGLFFNNLIPNGNFENAPSFTAATSTQNQFIDGTANGNTSDSTYGWSLGVFTGSSSAQFDNSTSNCGAYSIKGSTLAV